MNHMMIDVEALRLKQPWLAPLMSLGLVVFDSRGVVMFTEEIYVDSESWPDHMQAEQGTVDFWKGQEYYPTLLKLMAEKGQSVLDVLNRIRTIYIQWRVGPVWFAGPTYDQVMLEAYYHGFNQEAPWGFNKSRDFRTIRCQHPEIYQEMSTGREGLHEALEDSLFQVSVLRAIVDADPAHSGWN